jgi:hypothetical protein
VTAGGSSLITGSDRILELRSSGGGNNSLLRYSDGATAKYSVGFNNNEYIIYDDTGGGRRLQITSTGAATFSSSVTAGGNVNIPNGNYYYAKRNTGSANINILGIASGTDTTTLKGGTAGANTSIIFADTGGAIARFYNGALEVGYATVQGAGYKLDVNGTGRFSGALNGTSATFSSTGCFGGGTNGGATFAINNGGAEAKQTFAGFSSNLNLTQCYNNSGAVYVVDEYRAASYSFKIGTTAALTIASTGAATFNSSVTATSLDVASTPTFSASGNTTILSTTNLSVAAGATFNTGGVWAASRQNNLITWNGSVSSTMDNGAVIAGQVAVNRHSFGAAGYTINPSQSGSNIRALAGLQVLQQTGGSYSGTITYGASMFIQGIYPTSAANVTFTNYYGLLINNLDEWGGVTLTNRWGIYQAGSSDANYLAGKLQVGSATAVSGSYKAEITGILYASSGLITGNPTGGTAQTWKLGSAYAGTISSNYYVNVEINGTTYSLLASNAV